MNLRHVWILVTSYLLLAISPAQAAYPQNPLLFNDSIYVSQQGVYKFDRKQHVPLWSNLLGIETFAPVALEDLLLVGSTRGLYALDLESGDLAWHIEPQHTLFTPSIADKAYAGSLHGELYAIEPRDGSIGWRRQFEGWIYSPVIDAASDRLWTGGQAHQVYATSIDNGKLLQQITTTQESVFSPVDLGRDQTAFNLFDGSTLVLGLNNAQGGTILAGDSQPNGIYAYRDTVYRSHRDGTLSAFDRQTHKLRWRRSLTPQDLVMHPSQPGYLLLSDRDRTLLLLDLNQTDRPCLVQHDLRWMLPLQLDDRNIIYFQKSMQPPGMTLVQTEAHCK
jgi:outer membrane protein assembly factor BamB